MQEVNVQDSMFRKNLFDKNNMFFKFEHYTLKDEHGTFKSPI